MPKTPADSPKPRSTAKRATLKTISELTGLSLSTVSLSLRGGASLKEETRRKVAEAAARNILAALDGQPDPAMMVNPEILQQR